MAHVISYSKTHQFQIILDIIGSILLIVPLIYVLGVLLYKLLSHSHCVQVCRKVKTWLLCYCKEIAHADSQESLPDRIADDHPKETTALLPPEQVQWDNASEATYY